MILVVIIAILIVGGGLTSLLMSSEGGASVLPILPQTAQPDASTTTMLPWKAEQFFLLIGFIIFNLVGIAATLALIFWFVDRGLRRNAANTTEKQVTTSET